MTRQVRKLKHARRSTKLLVALLSVVVVAVLAGAAFAYYGGTGSSSAQSATLGHAPMAVTVTVDSLATTLYPGDSESIVAHISAGTRRAYIGSVSYAVSGLPAGCLASWFTAPTVSVGSVIPAGGSTTATGTLTFVDANAAQDACSDATPSVVATASPTP